jgi:integrase
MPRLTHQTPKYRKHKASGQAIVEFCGRRHYLGPHGTRTSKLEYDRLVGEWLQGGRILRPEDRGDGGGFTNVELIVAYLHFAKGYYRKDDRQTGEYEALRHALRFVKLLYGRKPVAEFGPIALQSVMHKMIDSGLARGTINRQVGRIKRMFKWGVSQELIPADISHALQSVSGLRKGRTTAKETGAVLPIADTVVDATLTHLPDVPADMVRLQRLTGCRPAELCLMRPCDIDRTVDP